ncbi:MAG: hypothetical protein ABEJ60_03000 [Halodesulfurarchaeum sp.]
MASLEATDHLDSLARTAIVGGILGAGLPLFLLALGWTSRMAITRSFSIGGLTFGFGLTVWAGSLMTRRTIAAASTRLGRSFDVEKTIDAMGVLIVLGGTWMIGTTIASVLLSP